jgi:trimethylamine--corrinoid protein Co-methyltransferase
MGSLAQMVIDDDIIASVKRALRGFQVDEESLAFSVIAAVMDKSHNFLAEKHTIKYLRAGELGYTHHGERRSFDEWARSGREGMAERAQAKAAEILAKHEVSPLSQEQEKELDAILLAAQNELCLQT